MSNSGQGWWWPGAPADLYGQIGVGRDQIRGMDSRYSDLARVLTGFSTRLEKGKRVLIDAYDVPDGIVVALVRAARDRGAIPYVNVVHQSIQRELLRHADEAYYDAKADNDLDFIQQMQAYIALRGAQNIFELSDVPSDRMDLAMRRMKPHLDHRVKKTKWVVLRWPTSAMAQQARMSTEQFEDFYFRVCTLDYARMTDGMAALKERMEATDEVRIQSPGTDLRFSIKGISAIPCGGLRNIPDGEVFTAPVRDSVEGKISYNTPTVYRGTGFERVELTFKDGKIVEATSSNPKKLNEILDSDEGARFIGEFAIGFNPHILEPMQDILFDEKIAGSFHFTPGQAYEEADNGNRSQVHWDMVLIQRPEYGGGTISFDGEVIRKDGIFTDPKLEKLNPDYLLAS
jgi:aminopeptidase